MGKCKDVDKMPIVAEIICEGHVVGYVRGQPFSGFSKTRRHIDIDGILKQIGG